MRSFVKHRLSLINHAGFSLMDIILVLMIIGIVGMIAAPQIHSMITEAKLNEAAGELASGLEYAKSLAVEYQKPFGLEVTGNSFRIFDYGRKTNSNPDHEASPPVDAYGVVLNPLDKKWYSKNFDTLDNYTGVDITSAPTGDEIRFFPDGHCSDPNGTVNTFVISYAGYQRTITISSTTGRINIE